MIYCDFINEYYKKYNLNLDRKKYRLKGQELQSFKMLAYILRIYFNLSFGVIEISLDIYKQTICLFYYEVLGNKVYRNEARHRYEEIYTKTYTEQYGGLT